MKCTNCKFETTFTYFHNYCFECFYSLCVDKEIRK